MAWVNLEKVDNILARYDVEFIGYGERENRTDGETHRFYRKGEDVFELHGNYYVAESWEPLLRWAEGSRKR